MMLLSSINNPNLSTKETHIEVVKQALWNTRYADAIDLRRDLGLMDQAEPPPKPPPDYTTELVYLEEYGPDETRAGLAKKLRSAGENLREQQRTKMDKSEEKGGKKKEKLDPKVSEKKEEKDKEKATPQKKKEIKDIPPPPAIPITPIKYDKNFLKILKENKLMLGTDSTGKETICPIQEEKKKMTWKQQLTVCERLSRNKGQLNTRPILSNDFMDNNMDEELKMFDSVKLSPHARISVSITSPPPEVCWVHPVPKEEEVTETRFLEAFLKGREKVELLSELPCSRDSIEDTPPEEEKPLPDLESILWSAFEGLTRIHNPLHAPDRDLIALALRDQMPVHFHREIIRDPEPDTKALLSPTSSCNIKSVEPLLTTGYDMHIMQGKIRKDRIYRALPSSEEQRDSSS